MLVPELQKFGIQLDKKRSDKLRQQDTAVIGELISELFEIDNSPMTVANSQQKNGQLADVIDHDSAKSAIEESTEAATSHVSGQLNPLKGLVGLSNPVG